jgi:NADH pyrophosphatase NudC (nudix superfamily)
LKKGVQFGCHSVAASASLKIDGAELGDARWFSRDEVMRDNEGGAFVAPPPRAIRSLPSNLATGALTLRARLVEAVR